MANRYTAWVLSATAAVLMIPAGCGKSSAGRDYIYIVGSSTVYPFATLVAERFGHSSVYKTPKVEATGSGGGLKLFCDGVGVGFPDVTNSSRPIKPSEIDTCERHGVTGIVEIKIGYDGIVFANAISAPAIDVSRRELFLALAKQIPGERDGQLIDNPYRYWSEINPGLPDERIEVLGPPPTSGTRDVLVELALESGCRTFGWIDALHDADVDHFKSICHTVREDGAFVEAGENDNLIVQKLEANPGALGIFGFSFLDQNTDKVKGAKVDGVAPTFEAIGNGAYPVSRPLFFYVKKAHVDVIPGLRAFLRELSSERAWGEEGYLADRGLIPMPEQERRDVALGVRNLRTLALVSR